MRITTDLLDQVTPARFTKAGLSNARSVVTALDKFGSLPAVQLVMPHRLAHFLAQLFHESGDFQYDREIWGPTKAQSRYEGRADLGNTSPGDGERYAGRTAGQITGRANYRSFTKWVRANIDRSAPDFEANPELMNTDPWEGLGPIWFWSVNRLNEYADKNDLEMITHRLNGGTNGLEDRIRYYTRVALVLAGFGPDDVVGFQLAAQNRGLLPAGQKQADGVPGPKTRAALHRWLALESSDQIAADPEVTVTSAPVVQKEEVPVVPRGVDKPGRDIGAIVTAAVSGPASQYVEPVLGTFGGLSPYIQALLVFVFVAALVYLLWGRAWMASRARTLVARVEERRDAGLPG